MTEIIKQPYETPLSQILIFDEDVISTSGDNTDYKGDNAFDPDPDAFPYR